MTVKMCIKSNNGKLNNSQSSTILTNKNIGLETNMRYGGKPKRLLLVNGTQTAKTRGHHHHHPYGQISTLREVNRKPNNNGGGDNPPKITLNQVLSEFVKTNISTVGEDRDAGKATIGTKAFIAVMQHSLNCSGCPQLSCRKMCLVMKHYISCGCLKNGTDCTVCRQLLWVVAEHALYLCPSHELGPTVACPVPMCDVMRATIQLKMAQATSAQQ